MGVTPSSLHASKRPVSSGKVESKENWNCSRKRASRGQRRRGKSFGRVARRAWLDAWGTPRDVQYAFTLRSCSGCEEAWGVWSEREVDRNANTIRVV